MADTLVLGTSAERRESSNLSGGTSFRSKVLCGGGGMVYTLGLGSSAFGIESSSLSRRTSFNAVVYKWLK